LSFTHRFKRILIKQCFLQMHVDPWDWIIDAIKKKYRARRNPIVAHIGGSSSRNDNTGRTVDWMIDFEPKFSTRRRSIVDWESAAFSRELDWAGACEVNHGATLLSLSP
jgi:hypothetical protein